MDLAAVPFPLSAVPFPLSWAVPPASAAGDGHATLTVGAGPRTDMFADPGGGEPVLTAPRLLGVPPDGDFQLSAQVRVGFAGSFDAGTLLVWIDEEHWAKLCFEFSPQGQPMVVSVVTRGVSDDANGFTVDGDTMWLRVSRLGGAWAFHGSTDGTMWHFVRFFALPSAGPVRVGFEAQSPVGDGCLVRFERIRFSAERLADLRGGD
jgi:regulation of enolase protein 1 (concanavalin A-like superfamily)